MLEYEIIIKGFDRDINFVSIRSNDVTPEDPISDCFDHVLSAVKEIQIEYKNIEDKQLNNE